MNQPTWEVIFQAGEVFFLLAGGKPGNNSGAAEHG